jgi:TrmH family RNA methyltransferase
MDARRFLLEGPNAAGDALADDVVEELFVTLDEAPVWRGAPVPVTVVADHVLERIATTRSPQGVVGIGRLQLARLDELPARGLVVAAHEVNDPGNAGTLVRIADAVGAVGLVLTTGSVDPWNPKAVRAAAGSTTHLPLVVDVPAAEVVEHGRGRGRVVALDGSGAVDVDDVPVDLPVTLFAGSESHGLPTALLGACDIVARIPMWGRSESLNVAAATAVAAYSVARRIHAPGGLGA